jgi:tetratricopeptide (TPR) repeat protein
VLAAACSVATYLAQAGDQAVQSLEALPLAERAGTALVGAASYVRHFVYPDDLSVYYPRPDHLAVATVVGASILIAGITAGTYTARRFAGWAVVCGWLLFLGMLLPVIGLVQVGDQASADRYMYGPILGLLVSSASLVIAGQRRMGGARLRGFVIGAFSLWIVAASATTFRQVGRWSDTYTLASASLQAVGPAPQLLSMKATILMRARKYADALPLLRQALELAPTHYVALQNMALCEFKLGDTNAAIETSRRLIAQRPDSSTVWINYALYLLEAGRHGEAREALAQASTKSSKSSSAAQLSVSIEAELDRQAARANMP